jgi:septal ring factor EnvC (AmiA/AmiB activator)
LRNRRLWAGLVLALASASPWAAPKQELEEVRDRLQELQTELEASEQSRAEAADQLRASERAISKANRRLRDLTRERDTVRRELHSLRERSERLQSDITRQQDAYGRMLQDQHRNGRAEPLRLLLTRHDPNDVARQMRYLTYVAKARSDVVRSLETNLAEVANLSRQAGEREHDLAEVEKAHDSERRTLEQEKAARKEALASVSAELAKQRKEYATLKRDEERLGQLIAKLARALAKPKTKVKGKVRDSAAAVENASTPEDTEDSVAFRALKGKLRLPISGELATRFGSPRGDDGFSRKGVFIRARNGQEVKAVAQGRVVFAEWLRGFGNLVIVDHGGGYMSLYGNNEALYKQPGDAVRAGDVLASVGASGGQEESGLYFELRHQGKPFDPLPWAPPRP